MFGWVGLVMRQKAFVLFLVCVLLTTLVMVLLPVRRHTTLNTLVKETQNKISNLRDNIISAGETLDSNQISVEPDIRYLQQLGLASVHSSGVYEDELLLVVTAVEPGSADLAPGLIRSVAHYQPDANILIYDLGTSRSEKELLNHICNSTLCSVSEFQFSLWPNHVKDLKLRAYRPIGIQLALRDSNMVLWLDIDCRFTASDISIWMTKVKESGVVAWSQDPLTKEPVSTEVGSAATPTTALTHPRMFEYFPQVKKEDYEFQHMVSGRCLLFYPSASPPSLASPVSLPSPSSLTSLSYSLILPWIKCVLIEDCINPIGAQSTGCRFDKKPQYRYSGCHSYDVSALNIVLGKMFSFHESRYLSRTPFFKKVDQELLSLSTSYLNISDYGLV